VNREIVIHSLDQARAALAAAAALDLSVTIASASGAAMQAGPAWFKAVIDAARAAHPEVEVTAILDCGEEPGAVMAALRTGLTQLRFAGDPALCDKLAAMGATWRARPPAEARLDLHGVQEPEAACRAFLAQR